MTRIRKEKPKPHIVIPDTSAIWYEDKRHCVDPEFDKFWLGYAEEFGFEIVIPEVVRGELLFQHTTSATKSLRRANQAISDVSNVTQRYYRHRVTDQRIKHEVEQKFRKWELKHHAKVFPNPISSIDWADIIHRAVWRKAPFTYDPKNEDNEKGFRDCIILESVKTLCSQEQRDISIVFLCKDNLLRETAEHILTKDKRFSTYELVTDFKTYLDLTKERLEDAFIKGVVRHAAQKFFDKGDSHCLLYRDNIKGMLQEQYRNYFENPEESEKKGLVGVLTSLYLTKWNPTDPGMFWVSRSQFLEKDKEQQYVWSNTVTYVRQYAGGKARGDLSVASVPDNQNRLLILPFLVTWRAQVTSDGRFLEYELVKHELKDNQFRETSDEDRRVWKLEEPKR